MFNELWLLNIFLITHVIGFLAFIAFGWLYVDAYRKGQKHIHNIVRGIGGIAISLGFLLTILENINRSSDVSVSALQMLVFSTGITLIVLANFYEPVPLLPSLGKKKTKYEDHHEDTLERIFFTHSTGTYKALVSIASFIFPFLGVGVISYQIFYKVKYGWSKNFKILNFAWIGFGIYIFFGFLNFVWARDVVWIDELTRDFSIGWVFAQVSALVASVLVFVWVYQFLSFRVFAKMFLSIWQITIFVSVAIASIYSIFTIQSVENQIVDLLGNNVELVTYNIEQISENSKDIVQASLTNDAIISSIDIQNVERVQDLLDSILQTNRFLDQIIVTDESGRLIYNSDNPLLSGVSTLSNVGIGEVIDTNQEYNDYLAVEISTNSKQLVYQTTTPISNSEGTFIGTISTVKRFDDLYLDLLREQTDQQILIYVDNARSASTQLQENEIRRLENIPHFVGTENYSIIRSDDDIEFGRATIYTNDYYTALQKIVNKEGVDVADLVVATEQSILIETNEQTLINTFLFAVFVSLFATIPSYLLAKSLEKNISA
jgi:hypothetical protein